MYALNRLMPKTFIPLHTMVRLKIFREIFEGRKAITIRTEPTLVKYCYPMLQGQNETYKYP